MFKNTERKTNPGIIIIKQIYLHFMVVGEVYFARLNMLETYTDRKNPTQGKKIRDQHTFKEIHSIFVPEKKFFTPPGVMYSYC